MAAASCCRRSARIRAARSLRSPAPIAARTAEAGARGCGDRAAFGRWEELIEHADIDAVAIATPPRLQPAIAVRALERGKPVFVEKPLAADLDSAAAMLRQAAGGPPAMIDFGFPEIPPWRKAKALIDDGAIGALRHVGAHLERGEPRDAHAAAELEDQRAPTAAARSAISSATRCIIWNGSAARSRGCRRGCPDCPTTRRSRRPSRCRPPSARAPRAIWS